MANNYEFLKPVLGDELHEQFVAKMGEAQGINLVNVSDGSHIPKAKFDEERNTSKAYKTQIDELNAKLAEMQEAANGNETLKNQIVEMQNQIAAKDAEMQRQSLGYAIKDAVRGSEARNVDVVMKMLDIDKITTDKNGQLKGLDDQLEALKKSDGYLFGNGQPNNGGIDPHNDPDPIPNTANGAINDLIRHAAGR